MNRNDIGYFSISWPYMFKISCLILFISLEMYANSYLGCCEVCMHSQAFYRHFNVSPLRVTLVRPGYDPDIRHHTHGRVRPYAPLICSNIWVKNKFDHSLITFKLGLGRSFLMRCPEDIHT
jgi:hypothetical protein